MAIEEIKRIISKSFLVDSKIRDRATRTQDHNSYSLFVPFRQKDYRGMVGTEGIIKNVIFLYLLFLNPHSKAYNLAHVQMIKAVRKMRDLKQSKETR